MNEKKYLNEENYERGKKKLKRLSLTILIVGILLGSSLILTGIFKSKEAKIKNTPTKIEERSKDDIEQEINNTKSQIAAIDLEIENLKKEITNLTTEKSKLRNEQNKVFQEDNGFSDRYYAIEDEINQKDNEISSKNNKISQKEEEKFEINVSLMKLETELSKVNSGYRDAEQNFKDTKANIEASKYIPLYIIGTFIIISSSILSGIIYMISKRREIMAFTAQQAMPVIKEGAEEITPTIGKVTNTIAKEISKGIKEGKEDK